MSQQPDFSYKPKRHGDAALPNDNAVFLDTLANGGEAGLGQFVLIDPATGYASQADASTPGMIAGGTANQTEQSATSTSAGKARLFVSWGCSVGRPNSTTANDGFTIADVGVPAYAAGASTCGKLSHTGTVTGANLANRSCVGLVLGLDPDSPSGGPARPLLWDGPVAHAVARGVMLANANTASLHKVIDAGAGTDTVNGAAESLIPRTKTKGTVIAVEFDVEGTTLSASGGTDYTTLSVYRRAGQAGDTPVLIATADTKTTAWTQWTTISFTLSAVAGALDNLETSLLTVVKTHGGSGAIVPAGNLRVIERTGI
jgi:hypothetical protein